MIHRQHRTRRFTITPNDLWEADDLGWSAKGLLGYLLSRPDGWNAKLSHLATVGRDGRDATATARRQLVEAGWLVEVRQRDRQGRLHTVTHVFDTPGNTEADIPDETGYGVSGSGEAGSGVSGSGDAVPIVNTETARTEVTTTDNNPSMSDSDEPDPDDVDGKGTPTVDYARQWAGFSKDVHRITRMLAAAVRANGYTQGVPKPSATPARWVAWAADIDRLLRIGPVGNDNPDLIPTVAEVERGVSWATTDDFWRTNIRSAATFRKQWPTVRLRCNEPGGQRHRHRHMGTYDAPGKQPTKSRLLTADDLAPDPNEWRPLKSRLVTDI